jgi:hypothetical protein
MRFYTNQHRYYCGIDLHARRMYICVLDADGQVRVQRDGREVVSRAEVTGVAPRGREVTPTPPLDTILRTPTRLDGHDASRCGPTRHDLEGARYLGTPRNGATRVAHRGRGTEGATPEARPRRQTARERVR